jgi:hypothetical protein
VENEEVVFTLAVIGLYENTVTVKRAMFNKLLRNLLFIPPGSFAHKDMSIKTQGVAVRTHKSYFPIAETSIPTSSVLLKLRMGYISL